MKIAFFSSDPIAVESIECVRAEHELVCVVSNPDKPKGRGKKLSPNDVAQWALDNSVELLRPRGKPSDDDVQRLRNLGAELLVVMAYGCILKDNILHYGKYPCINLHASLLPQLRGASPIETAIALGMEKTGVSLMRVEPAMDSGAVADTMEVSISGDDTSATLRAKISRAAAEVLRRNLPKLGRGELEFVPQDSSLATYARKLSKDDMFLDFSKSAAEIRNRVRAFGAGIFAFNGECVKIFDVETADADVRHSDFGRVVCADSRGLKIACASGSIIAKRLQRPCANALCARDFFAGFEIPAGTILASADNKLLLRK